MLPRGMLANFRAMLLRRDVWSNLVFFATGMPLFLLNQQITYLGGNDARSQLMALAQYSGMLLVGLLWGILPRTDVAQLRRVFVWIAMPVALTDLADTGFTAYGYTIGSGLFAVLYSFVTVMTALIRRYYLGRTLRGQQWAAVWIITFGMAVSGADQFSLLGGYSPSMLLGMGSVLVAAFCDAIMYVLAESALRPSEASNASARGIGADNAELLADRSAGETAPMSPNTLATLVGLVNLTLTCAYIAIYSAFGGWNAWVAEPIEHAGGHFSTVALLWAIQGPVNWAHYWAFYITVQEASCIVAAVNKAVQAVALFFLSWMIWCRTDEAQCLTVPKSLCSVLVSGAVVLYAVGQRSCPDALLCDDFLGSIAVAEATQAEEKAGRQQGACCSPKAVLV